MNKGIDLYALIPLEEYERVNSNNARTDHSVLQHSNETGLQSYTDGNANSSKDKLETDELHGRGLSLQTPITSTRDGKQQAVDLKVKRDTGVYNPETARKPREKTSHGLSQVGGKDTARVTGGQNELETSVWLDEWEAIFFDK